jgi:hypothetical protein
MKRLILTTTLAAISACHPMQAKAIPNPSNLKSVSTLKDTIRKQSKQRILDVYNSKIEAAILQSNGIRFVSNSTSDSNTESMRAISEELTFEKPALNGKFFNKGQEAVVLFRDGELEFIRFSPNPLRLSCKLFSPAPVGNVKIIVSGDTFWFLEEGTRRAIRIKKKDQKIDIQEILFEEKINEGEHFECNDQSCKRTK